MPEKLEMRRVKKIDLLSSDLLNVQEENVFEDIDSNNYSLKNGKGIYIPSYKQASINRIFLHEYVLPSRQFGDLKHNGVRCKLFQFKNDKPACGVKIACQVIEDPETAMISEMLYDCQTNQKPTSLLFEGKMVIVYQNIEQILSSKSRKIGTRFKSWELPFPTKQNIKTWGERNSDYRTQFLDILKKAQKSMQFKFEDQEEYSDATDGSPITLLPSACFKEMGGAENYFVFPLKFSGKQVPLKVFRAHEHNSKLALTETTSELSDQKITELYLKQMKMRCALDGKCFKSAINGSHLEIKIGKKYHSRESSALEDLFEPYTVNIPLEDLAKGSVDNKRQFHVISKHAGEFEVYCTYLQDHRMKVLKVVLHVKDDPRLLLNFKLSGSKKSARKLIMVD